MVTICLIANIESYAPTVEAVLCTLEHEVLGGVVVLEVGAVELEARIDVLVLCALIDIELCLFAEQLIEYLIQCLALEVQDEADKEDELQDDVERNPKAL